MRRTGHKITLTAYAGPGEGAAPVEAILSTVRAAHVSARGSIGAVSNYPAGPSASPGHGPGFGQWRLASRLELGPLPSAVPCARLHTKNIFREWDLAHVAEDAELIVSELFTNALKAARSLPDIQPVTPVSASQR